MNDSERRIWILNDEGLYDWWLSTDLSTYDFIKISRSEIDTAIEAIVSGRKPAHYLKYGP